MVREKVNTMCKMFDFVGAKFATKRCLGTRQILAEEDEMQPNGRIFKKVSNYFVELFIVLNNRFLNICFNVVIVLNSIRAQ